MKTKLLIILTVLLGLNSYSQSLDTTITKQLHKGWNLVGFVGQNPESTMSALGDIMDKVEVIKTLDGYYNPEQEEFLNSLDELLPLDGIFIKVKEDCVLERTIKKSAILYVDTETDPVFSAWAKDYNDLTNKPNFPDSVALYSNTDQTAPNNNVVTSINGDKLECYHSERGLIYRQVITEDIMVLEATIGSWWSSLPSQYSSFMGKRYNMTEMQDNKKVIDFCFVSDSASLKSAKYFFNEEYYSDHYGNWASVAM